MSRKMSALLIAAESGQAAALPCALDKLEVLEALLRRRFADRLTLSTLTGSNATTESVVSGFRELARLTQPGDLALVAFVGHGYSDDKGQGWALFDGNFSDFAIADALARFDWRAEVVLVSDACYGAGVLRAGQKANQLSGDLVKGLAKRMSSAPWRLLRSDGQKSADPRILAPPSVVCVASAQVVKRTMVCSAFLPELCSAIPVAPTYRSLIQFMRNISVQTHWEVDAIPEELLDQRPLATD